MRSKQRQKETPVFRKLSRNNMSNSLNMKKITILIVALASVLTSCSVNDSQNKDLRQELETLKKELAECKNGKSHHHEHDMETLPVEKRIAFMSGHVEVGLVLYRAGKPDQASKHLLHPVSEMHQAERAGIDALGFEPNVFKSVSIALEEGRPASEIEPMLKKAEENIMYIQKNAGGDVSDIIKFLMETVNEEYAIGVKDGKIVEAGEYQDAYGFSSVALKMSKRYTGDNSQQLVQELRKLLSMWPVNAPLADSKPKSVEKVIEQTKKVLQLL